MSELLAYLAGIVDGEGTVQYLSKGVGRSPAFFMKVKMTDKPIVLLLHETFGGSLMFCKREKPHYKDQWRWSVSHKKAWATYAILEPFLRLKRMPKPDYFLEG